MAKVSIIVPVYNTEKYLKECVDSVLNQTMSDLELVLVDDGSTDSSGKICDEYVKYDNRVNCIHQPNGGAGKARNTGIRAAVGEYLLFLDSDDYLNTDLLKQLLNNNRTYDMLFFQFSCIKNGKKTDIRQPLHLIVDQPLNFMIFNKRSKGIVKDSVFEDDSLAVYTTRILIRREFLLNNNILFNEELRLSEDRILLFEMLLSTKSIGCREDVFGYNYRLHGTDSLVGELNSRKYKPWLFKQITEIDKTEQEVCKRNPSMTAKDLEIFHIRRASHLRTELPLNEFAYNRENASNNFKRYRKNDFFVYSYRWGTLFKTRPFPGLKEIIKFICVKFKLYSILKTIYRVSA